MIINAYWSSCKTPFVFVRFEFCGPIFEKQRNIKIRQNPCCGSRVVQCGQTDRQTHRTKLIVAFRNFVDTPENHIDSDSRLYLGTVLPVFFFVTGDTELTVRYEM